MLKYQVQLLYSDKSKREWYLRYGVCHRKVGPVYLTHESYVTWNQYGKRHRLNRPAVIWYVHTEYWIRGKRYAEVSSKTTQIDIGIY